MQTHVNKLEISTMELLLGYSNINQLFKKLEKQGWKNEIFSDEARVYKNYRETGISCIINTQEEKDFYTVSLIRGRKKKEKRNLNRNQALRWLERFATQY